jgi:hypothetical protein
MKRPLSPLMRGASGLQLVRIPGGYQGGVVKADRRAVSAQANPHNLLGSPKFGILAKIGCL